jgi:PKD repeat protein
MKRRELLENGMWLSIGGASPVGRRQIKEVVCSSPVADFTFSPTEPYVGESVSFDASDSNHPDASIDSYLWDFGDGTIDGGRTVSHTYASEGSYDVELTVLGSEGGIDKKTETVSVSEACSGSYSVVDTVTATTEGSADGDKTVAKTVATGLCADQIRFSIKTWGMEWSYSTKSGSYADRVVVTYGDAADGYYEKEQLFFEEGGNDTWTDLSYDVSYKGSNGELVLIADSRFTGGSANATIAPPDYEF